MTTILVLMRPYRNILEDFISIRNTCLFEINKYNFDATFALIGPCSNITARSTLLRDNGFLEVALQFEKFEQFDTKGLMSLIEENSSVIEALLYHCEMITLAISTAKHPSFIDFHMINSKRVINDISEWYKETIISVGIDNASEMDLIIDELGGMSTVYKTYRIFTELSSWHEGLGFKESIETAERFLANLRGMIGEQLSMIAQDDELLRMEASWRGLKFLVDVCSCYDNMKVVLVTMPRTLNDQSLDRITQTQVMSVIVDGDGRFRTVRTQERVGYPDILVLDYYISHTEIDAYEMRGLLSYLKHSRIYGFAGANAHAVGLNKWSDLEKSTCALEFVDAELCSIIKECSPHRLSIGAPDQLVRSAHKWFSDQADADQVDAAVINPIEEGACWINPAYLLGARCIAETRKREKTNVIMESDNLSIMKNDNDAARLSSEVIIGLEKLGLTSFPSYFEFLRECRSVARVREPRGAAHKR